MAHPRLNTIPPEILDGILDYIEMDTEKRQNAFLSLSYTCRDLRDFGQARLLHTIDFTWPIEDRILMIGLVCSGVPKSYQPRPFCPDPRLHLLLRTILTRPDLALNIYHVHLDSWNVYMLEEYCREHGVQASYNDREIESLKSLLLTLALPDKGMWLKRVFAGDNDSIAALVISQLVNLCSLDLVVDYSKNRIHPRMLWTMFAHVFNREYRPQSTFPEQGTVHFAKLKKLKYNTQRYMKLPLIDTDVHQLAPLFSLPALDDVALSLLDLPLVKTLDFTQSNITTLYLQHSVVEVAEGVLKACPRLRSLYYVLDIYMSRDDPPSYFNLPKLQRALNWVKDTLETLTVIGNFFLDEYGNSMIWTSSFNEYSGIIGRLSEMSSFMNLTTLNTTLMFLTGYQDPEGLTLADVLPPNLQEFGIINLDGVILQSWESNEDQFRMCEIVTQHFLEMDKSQSTRPWLERINFEIDHFVQVESSYELIEAIEKLGVEFLSSVLGYDSPWPWRRARRFENGYLDRLGRPRPDDE